MDINDALDLFAAGGPGALIKLIRYFSPNLMPLPEDLRLGIRWIFY